MEKVYEISLLLDFYGPMLTKRQLEIMELHYNNDYSLGEIAEHFNISRQGVYDNIKRSKLTLNSLEIRLGLVAKFSLQRRKAQDILKKIELVERSNLNMHDLKLLREIKGSVEELADL